MESLCTFAIDEDALFLVRGFRVRFQGDPGLDGCLLELEEILNLQAKHYFQSSLLTLDENKWVTNENMKMPQSKDSLEIFDYVENDLRLYPKLLIGRSQWNLIRVPRGFDVIDVVLVDVSESPVIYGIQITLSSKPFDKHHTFETCPPRSKEKLETLWSVISDHFSLGDVVEKYFVMRAPNCKDESRPPDGHLSDFYFSHSLSDSASNRR